MPLSISAYQRFRWLGEEKKFVVGFFRSAFVRCVFSF